MQLTTWVETAVKDLRYAARTLARNPGFTSVAILALGLGIGANSAMFSVVNAILLKPLPYREPDRLLWIAQHMPRLNADLATNLDYFTWRDQHQLFDEVAAFTYSNVNLLGDEPERIRAAQVSESLLRTLGSAPSFGRGITAEEDRPGSERTAILMYSLWKRRFAADPSVIGRTLNLDDTPYRIVGVMDRDFRFPDGADIDAILPLAAPSQPTREGNMMLISVIARTKPGITPERVRADLDVIRKRGPRPAAPGSEMRVVPLHRQIVGDNRTALLVLLGAVGMVLLIACGNVANLLLGRAAARQREVAVRAALGGSRGRLIRQLLTESLLLACAGAALGLLFARLAIRAVIAMGSSRLPFIEQTSIDPTVLGFTTGIAILTGIVFGLVPAISASRTDVIEALKRGGTSLTAASAHRRFRGALVVSEVALALVLLVGASLLIRSLWTLQSLDPGFLPDHLLVAEISPIPSHYATNPQKVAFYDSILEKIDSLPGVEASAVYQDKHLGAGFQIAGRPPLPPNQSPMVAYDPVSPRFLQAMGMRLRRGRFIDDRDGANTALVGVINERVARTFFPSEDPLGQQFLLPPKAQPATIVGIVADMSDTGLGAEIPPTVFVPATQIDFVPGMHLVVRAAGDPLAIAGMVRDEIRSVDHDQPVFRVRTMEQSLATSIAPRRFSMILFCTFAALALVLAVVGIYAVMYSSVAQRTNEIGIRMALGAESSDVLRLILGQGGRLVITGLILGLAGSWATTRLLKSMLYQVSTTDLLTFTAASAVLFVVAIAASYLPAHRAAHIDPMIALRHE